MKSLMQIVVFNSAVFLLFTATVKAALITRYHFGPTTIVEDFENIVPYTSGKSDPYPNMQIITPLVFPSGVVMDEPVDSVSGTFGPYIVEFKGGGGFYGMGSDDDSGYIPSGTAYLGQANPGRFTDDIRLVFPTPVLRAGVYVATSTSSSDGSLTIEAYSAANQILESATVTNVHFYDWKSTFVGLEAEGIKYLMLRGNHSSVMRVDDVMYEVPEPCTWDYLISFLCATAVASLKRALCARRGNKLG